MSGAYYNEIDEFCARWLRNLMRHGLVAPGDVDTRSIEDVRPDDLRGYDQCHFFAGIGAWSRALRRAGWPDSRRVWTGSCPCQPFSSAGQGRGLGDERHLWPAWLHLIGERRPPVLLGEQVASKAAEPWLDLVHDDLEVLDYAFGAVPFPAASVGAPHIRDRLYWVAYDGRQGRRQECADARGGGERSRAQGVEQRPVHCGDGSALRLADSSSTRLEGRDARALGHECQASQRGGCACGLGQPDSARVCGQPRTRDSAEASAGDRTHDDDVGAAGALGGFWAAAEWIPCRDGKWRPVEPGTFPLAHGAAARVGRLRAYGNAIVAPQAEEWIRTVMSCMP